MAQPAPEDPREQPSEEQEADLLGIGLLVFFVALIAIVGALLVLPAVF